MEPMNTAGMMADVLREVTATLPTVVWNAKEERTPDGARVRMGESPDGWRFVIGAVFDADGRGTFDGAVNRGHIIMHLTPDLALRAWYDATAPIPEGT